MKTIMKFLLIGGCAALVAPGCDSSEQPFRSAQTQKSAEPPQAKSAEPAAGVENPMQAAFTRNLITQATADRLKESDAQALAMKAKIVLLPPSAQAGPLKEWVGYEAGRHEVDIQLAALVKASEAERPAIQTRIETLIDQLDATMTRVQSLLK